MPGDWNCFSQTLKMLYRRRAVLNKAVNRLEKCADRRLPFPSLREEAWRQRLREARTA